MKGSLSVCNLDGNLVLCICEMQIGQKKKKASVELIEQRKKKLNDAQS